MSRLMLLLCLCLAMTAARAIADPATASDEPTTRPTLERRLAKIHPPYRFEKVRLEDAVEFVRGLEVEVEVDWQELERGGVDRDTLLTFSVGASRVPGLLNKMIDRTILNQPYTERLRPRWYVKGGQVVITTNERRWGDAVTKQYDLREFALPDYSERPAAVAETVVRSVPREAWPRHGGPDTNEATFEGTVLTVTQAPDAHRAIEEVLQQFRSQPQRSDP